MTTREEHTGKKDVAVREKWADFAKRMTEKHVAFYMSIVDQDYDYLYFPEELMSYWPAGPDAARELNTFAFKQVTEFKQYASEQIKEYEQKGCLEQRKFSPGALMYNLLRGQHVSP